jgi:ABC-2 type transport system permease protein
MRKLRNISANLFANTGVLVKFILRREKVNSVIWVIIIAAFMAGLAPGIETMFPDDEALASVAAMHENPIIVAMMGPHYGIDADGTPTIGTIYAFMMLLWCMIAVAVMNVLFVAKHTRSDEEYGRAEVIRSLPVGRLANLHATMISAVIVNTVIGTVTGLALFATGTDGMDFTGSILCGMVLSVTGIVFAAITAVFCQLSAHSSGAAGLSFLALGVAYGLRTIGDIQSEALSLISPLGLAQRTQVFAGNNPVPLIILFLIAGGITALSYKLGSIRDLGQGFIAAKPGRSHAKQSLLSAWGLQYKLLRKAGCIWLIVMFSVAASYGSVVGGIDEFISDSPMYLQLMGISEEALVHLTPEMQRDIIVDAFSNFINVIMGVMALVPLLIFAMKLRSEEKHGRVESVIARSVSRTSYFVGFVACTFGFSIILQFATVNGLYLSTTAVAGDGGSAFVYDRLLWANNAFLPSIWVMIGLAVLIVGVFPKATGVMWGFYGVVCFLTLMGNLPDIPDAVKAISPFTHAPTIPVTEFGAAGENDVSPLPLIVMTIIAVMLTAAGIIGYKKRDMAA